MFFKNKHNCRQKRLSKKSFKTWNLLRIGVKTAEYHRLPTV